MSSERHYLTPEEMFEIWPDIWRPAEATAEQLPAPHDTLSSTLGDMALSDEIDYALLLKPLAETPPTPTDRRPRRHLELGRLKLHRALLPLAAVATGVAFAYAGQSESPAHAERTSPSDVKSGPRAAASGSANESANTSSTSRPKPGPSDIPEFSAANKAPVKSTSDWVPAGASSNLPKTSSPQDMRPGRSPSPSWVAPSESLIPSWPAPSESPSTPSGEDVPTPSEDAGTPAPTNPPDSSASAQPSESYAESASPSEDMTSAIPYTSAPASFFEP